MDGGNIEQQGNPVRTLLFIVWGAIPIILIYRLFGWEGYFAIGTLLSSRNVAMRVMVRGPGAWNMFQAMRYVWRGGLFVFSWQLATLMTPWFNGETGTPLIYKCPGLECLAVLSNKVNLGDMCLVGTGAYKFTKNGWALLKLLDGMKQ